MRRYFRRSAALLLCAMALLFSGCERLYIGSYISVTEHEELKLSTSYNEGYYEVHTYAGIRNALLELISAGREEGVIRTLDYEGSVQDDVARICLDVTRESAIGSYTVEFITHSVSRILSYYEIRFHISYRLDETERAGVQNTVSLAELYRLVDESLCDRQEKLAVQIATLSVSEQTMLDYVKGFYQQNPDRLSDRPSVSVSFFPSEEHVSKIVELSFSYPRQADEERERLKQIENAVSGMMDTWQNLSSPEYALCCCKALADGVTAQESGSTAYDALVAHHADSEGFAMAYRLLCSRSGVNCQVVEGKKNGRSHYWNILKLGQDYYHVDCSAGGNEALYFLLPDEALLGEYWWDVDRYPRCQGVLSAEQVMELCYGADETTESLPDGGGGIIPPLLELP